MSHLTDSATWLGERLARAAGRTVTLRQGATSLAGIVATPAVTEYEVADGEGFLTRIRAFDWVFEQADLEGLALRAGAVIVDGSARYEAMPVGTRPALEPVDALGTLVVLHTKRVV